MGPKRVAVLGAGFLGSCTSIELAMQGCDVDLIEAADVPLTGAGRWNEGKIHLGYLYSASGSLDTARAILPGGLDFFPAVARLLERDLEPWMSKDDDLYLIHEDSVTSADAAWNYFKSVSELVAESSGSGGYPGSLGGPRRLSKSHLNAVANTDKIVAGFRVPERSVDTQSLADALVSRLSDDPRICLCCGTQVLRVVRGQKISGANYHVETASGRLGPYDAVVNALWHGRSQVDHASFGFSDPDPHHRFRVSIFVCTDIEVPVQSAVIAAGPFGDVKNYNNRSFYASWYPAGLLAESATREPPQAPILDLKSSALITGQVWEALGELLPPTKLIQRHATKVHVSGGYVYAHGGGLLSDPGSALHRRDKIGILADSGYVSVDPGKYSTAPLFARLVAEAVCGTV